MDPDHVDETYPFSVGGRGDAFGFAEKLVGAERMGYNEAEEKKELPDAIKQAEKDQIEKDARKARGDIREEDMDMKKEIKFHLDAYKKGTIDGDDLAQAVEEVIFGEIIAPGMEEDLQREDESPNNGNSTTSSSSIRYHENKNENQEDEQQKMTVIYQTPIDRTNLARPR